MKSPAVFIAKPPAAAFAEPKSVFNYAMATRVFVAFSLPYLYRWKREQRLAAAGLDVSSRRCQSHSGLDSAENSLSPSGRGPGVRESRAHLLDGELQLKPPWPRR